MTSENVTANVCQLCGADKSHRRSYAKYCSEECCQVANGHRAVIKTRDCAICAASFTVNRGNHKYCSPACAAEGKRRYMERERRAAGVPVKPLGQPFNCAWCQVPCVPGENVSPGSFRFCGLECGQRYHRHHQDGTRRKGVRRRKEVRDRVFQPEVTNDGLQYRKVLRGDPCAYCGAPADALDHIEAKTLGGANGWENRTAICARCNSQKGTTSVLHFMGWRRAQADLEKWSQFRRRVA